ncbi:MAG: glycosyltransferase family 2 protein [Oligoflexales bacterium]
MSFSNLTFVLITYNEQRNIERCLSSLPSGSNILILDSGSTDQTTHIAAKFSAHIRKRKFDDYSQQRNAAIKIAKTPWIFMIDADEVLDDQLKKSIAKIMSNPPIHLQGFSIKRKLVFQGKKMNFGRTSDLVIRLFKKENSLYQHPIHEKLIISGKISHIQGVLWHYSYTNLCDYFERFNKYTQLVAKNHYTNKRKCTTVNFWLRFWIEFINRYILRLGFLDGSRGYTYAMISSFYAWTKFSKLHEMERYL